MTSLANRIRLLTVTALFAAGLGICDSLAADASKMSRDEAKQQLENEKKALTEAKTRASELSTSIAVIEKDKQALSQQLVGTAAKIKASEAALTEIEGKLDALGKDKAKLAKSLAGQHDVIVQLLSALQRMGRDPPPVVATNRSDALGMVRSALMLTAVFPDLKVKAVALAEEIGSLETVIKTEEVIAERQKAEKTAIEAEVAKLDQLLSAKRDELVQSQADFASARNDVVEQQKKVATLADLMAQLGKAADQKGPVATYDKKLEAGAAPGQIAPKVAANAGAGAPPAKPEDDAKRYAMLKPTSRVEPAMPFQDAKGLLPIPVSGSRILSYGQETKLGSRSKGIAIRTRLSARVTSPCDGWIVFAREFRSYGQLLIINAGGGYHILIAGMTQIDVTEGQFVLSGEPVGKMGSAEDVAVTDGSSGKTGGKSGDGPVLYVEFRNKERPINPDPWWGLGQDKVQG